MKIAVLGALAGRRDRRVRDVAAEAGQIEPLAAALDLGEFHQGLADGEDVERLHVRATLAERE